MRIAAIAIAVVLFAIALLYAFGVLQIGAHDAAPGKHHYGHFVLFTVLAALSLVWARFQKTATPAR